MNQGFVDYADDTVAAVITLAAESLVLGTGTWNQFKLMVCVLRDCQQMLHDNPELGFASNLALIEHTLNTVMVRVTKRTVEKEIEALWISPFLTIFEIMRIYELLYLLKNQYAFGPTLDPTKELVSEYRRKYSYESEC